MKPYISLILPVYNEEKRIAASLKSIYHYLRSTGHTYEILIVDDGSTDRTLELIRFFSSDKKVIKIIALNRNIGKGGAIREGVRQAKGHFIFFSDIDLSVPMTTIPLFLDKLETSYDVVISSRRQAGSTIKMHQHPLRQSLGHGFTKMASFTLGLNATDLTCGFKGFTYNAAKLLFSKSKINRWAFDAEIIFLARIYKLRTVEVPIIWTNKKGTKVNLLKDIPQTFVDVLLLKLRFLGK